MMKGITLICALILSGLTFSQTNLTQAVDFTIKDTQGNVHVLSDYLNNGKFVVIDFYSTSCGYCQIYAPQVQASYAHFGSGNGDVIFLTIDKGHTNEEVVAFDEEYGVSMPSASGLEGGGNLTHIAYEIQATPSVILIAPDYSIVEQMIWLPTTENIDNALLGVGLTMVGLSDPQLVIETNIFPNPAKETAILRVNSTQKEELDISIHNLSGRKLYNRTILHEGNGVMTFPIDVADFLPGVYFVNFAGPKGYLHAQRLIISN